MKCPHCGKETEEKKTAEKVYFDAFRDAYPRRVGGQRWPDARRCFERVLRQGISQYFLVTKARAYRDFCESKKILGTEYVMQAATFLGRGGGWEEDWSTETRFDSARRQRQEQP